jgi:antitoxin ChpS
VAQVLKHDVFDVFQGVSLLWLILGKGKTTICPTVFFIGSAMQVEIVLRKFGNSTGVAFPPAVLKDLGLKAGQSMTMDITADGKITLSPKRKYTLFNLIAQCDRKAPPPADMALWDAARSVGQEVGQEVL